MIIQVLDRYESPLGLYRFRGGDERVYVERTVFV